MKIFLVIIAMSCVGLFLWSKTEHGQSVLQIGKSTKSPTPSIRSVKELLNDTLALPTAKPINSEWQTITTGIQMKDIAYTYNEAQYGIQTLKIDPQKVRFSLQYDASGKTIADWAKAFPQAIISNAGFFKERNEPVGLLFINTERRDSHRISQKGTGLLLLEEGKVSIRNLGENPVDGSSQFTNAIQSYPLLLDKGQIKVLPVAREQDRRTAVGLDALGNVYLLTAQFAHLGLFDFAKTLEQSDIGFTQVLNLDGGSSTGVNVPFEGFQILVNSQTAVPTVLVIEPRE